MDEYLSLMNQLQTALESKNLLIVIRKSLRLCNHLLEIDDFPTYIQTHSKIIDFMFKLKNFLSDESAISKNDLEDGFFKALSCNFLVPRLYLSFFFALALKDKDYLSLVLKMADMIGKPLHILALRFAFASFLPSDIPIYADFIRHNFEEMLYYYSLISMEDKEKKSQIIGWITANISVVSHEEISRKLLDFFLEKSIGKADYNLSENLFRVVVSLIPENEIIYHLDSMKKFLNETEPTSEKLKLLHNIISETNDIDTMYSFISSLHYADPCKDKLLKRAIILENMNVIQKCAIKWPIENILRPIIYFLVF